MLDNVANIIGVLDTLPNSARVMLSAFVFALIAAILYQRVTYSQAGFNVTLYKVLLIASLLLPVTIGYGLDLRFVLFVDELPTPTVFPDWTWTFLYAIWAIGASLKFYLLARRIISIHIKSRQRRGISRKLTSRLEIWSRRIAVHSRFEDLVLDGENRPRLLGWPRTKLALPVASERWRTSTIDAVLVHDLSLVKANAPFWLILSELIACLYWFAPWMTKLTDILNSSFQGLADSLASSLIRDDLGYNSALRDMGNRIGNDINRYPIDSLIPQWGDSHSITDRIQHKEKPGYADPKYDRVFWSLSQVILLVFVLTGTTLDRARQEEDPMPFLFLYPPELQWGRSEDYDDKELETLR